MRLPALISAIALCAPEAKADLAHCHMLLELGSAAIGYPGRAQVSAPEGGCQYSDLLLRAPEGSAVFVDVLRLSGEGLDEFVDTGAPPPALRVEADGITFLPWGAPDLARWVVQQQQARNPLRLSLSYSWDPISGDLRITEASAVFDPRNEIQLSGTVSGLDLSSQQALRQALPRAALTEMSARIRSYGLFEEHLLMPLAYRFLIDFSDPDAGMSVLRGQALEALDLVPPAIVDDAGKAALAALVQELPRPSGELTLQLTAEPGLGMTRFAGFALTGVPRRADAFWQAFAGVTLDASWSDPQ